MDVDPWDWTVDDVATFFRERAADYISDVSNNNLPTLEPFLDVIRSQDITGYVLLQVVDTAILRDDCAIRSLGQRSAVMRCITKLRRESGKYAAEHGLVQPATRPAVATNPTQVSQYTQVSEAVSEPALQQQEDEVQQVRPRKRRRFDPAAIETTPLTHFSTAISVPNSYLPDECLLVDALIYGDNEPSQQPIRDGKKPGDVNFSLLSDGILAGSALVMHRKMKHLLMGGLPESHLDENRLRPSPNGTGEWDFLMDKYKVDEGDEELPLFGEQVGDRETDTNTDAADSLSDLKSMEDNTAPTKLSDEEVVEAVKAFTQKCIDDWQEKLPSREKEARTVWNKMKKSRTLRDDLTASAKSKIDHITSRLRKLQGRLLEDSFPSRDSVMVACQNLQPSIEERERHRWEISIWESRFEPGRAPRKGRAPRPAPRVQGQKPSTSFVVHPDDRLDFEPAEDAREDDIIYEADDEVNETPAESPATPALDTPPEDGLDGFVVDSSPAQDTHMPDYDEPLPVGTDKGSEWSPTTQLSPSGSSDNLASPSMLLLKLRVPRSELKKLKADVVDISHLPSSPSTPTKHGSMKPQSLKKERKQLKQPTFDAASDPFTASPAEIAKWEMDDFRYPGDRQRILILLLRDAEHGLRERITRLQMGLRPKKFTAELVIACRNLLPGAIQSDLGTRERATMSEVRSFYLQWFFVRKTKPELDNLQQADVAHIVAGPSPGSFVSMLSRALDMFKKSAFSRRDKPGSSSAPVVISSSDEANGNKDTPHKKRKKPVRKDLAAEEIRRKAAQRQQKHEASQSDPTHLAAMIETDPGQAGKIEVNPVRGAKDNPIFVSSHIALKMRSHQIEGLQFLWREITASEDDGGGQGCILAHTMGLGKTMQTIALLVALNGAVHSLDPGVRRQLPLHLRPDDVRQRDVRILVLSPPSLLQNWHREFDMWTQRGQVGDIDSIAASAPRDDRLETLRRWHRIGGVLLIGFTMFRNMVSGPARPGKGKDAQSRDSDAADDTHAETSDMLLNGPELVVVDECHQLKKRTTRISVAAAQFKTESRIGLTGTPMSNDVDEIYALVNFAAPGFLGDQAEFNGTYAEPIKQGLFIDSTAYEKRKSKMKQEVLAAAIRPKVNRATIEVLRGSLKPKVEFVITVPLGSLQRQLYSRTVTALLGANDTDDVSQVKLFGWLGCLSLAANHPHCFAKKLREPVKPKRTKTSKLATKGDGDDDAASTTEAGTPAPENGSITPASNQDLDAEDTSTLAEDPHDIPRFALGFTDEIVDTILEGYDGDMDPSLSAKTSIFLELLAYSRECNDKVLVFTGSIPTMNYLDALLKEHSARFGEFGRIDGSVDVRKRTSMLEKFHNDEFHIMLVSTKAGGVGLNIQGANRVFIFDFGFNPTWEQQAIGRAYRLGQEKPVFVYRFVCGGTFETNIYNKQLFKTSLAQRVVDKKNPRRNAERNAREWLYQPREVKQQKVHEWMGKDANVLDKLLSLHGSQEEGKVDKMVRAIETMETLQEDDPTDVPLTAEEQELVNQEIAYDRQRPKGKLAKLGPPSTSVANGRPSTQVPRVSTQMSAPRHNGHAHQPPPPSTHAGNFGRPMTIAGVSRPEINGLPDVPRNW